MDPFRRCGAGGILGLYRLLTEHGGAVEADLLHYYRVDLLDVWRGTLSWRRLTVLVAGLPAESATHRAAAGVDASWGLLEHLVAGLLDEVRVGNWWATAKHLKPRDRPDFPRPVPRPGVETEPEPPAVDPAIEARLLAMGRPKEDDDG